MTTSIVCDGELCDSAFESRKELFKMKKNGLDGLFCLGCVSQITKEDGWEMKSRDSLERYKEITGQDFVPYEDPGMMDDPGLEEDPLEEQQKQMVARDKAKPLVEMLESLVESRRWHWASSFIEGLSELSGYEKQDAKAKLLREGRPKKVDPKRKPRS